MNKSYKHNTRMLLFTLSNEVSNTFFSCVQVCLHTKQERERGGGWNRILYVNSQNTYKNTQREIHICKWKYSLHYFHLSRLHFNLRFIYRSSVERCCINIINSNINYYYSCFNYYLKLLLVLRCTASSLQLMFLQTHLLNYIIVDN